MNIPATIPAFPGVTIKQVPAHPTNFTNTRLGLTPYKAVQHCIAGSLSGADGEFTQANKNKSAHLGIAGNTIHQYMPLTATAWGASNWWWNLRGVNMEVEGGGPNKLPVSDESYETIGKFWGWFFQTIGAVPNRHDNLRGHGEVSLLFTECPSVVSMQRVFDTTMKYYNQKNFWLAPESNTVSSPVTPQEAPASHFGLLSPIDPGTTSDSVKVLQNALKKLGYFPLDWVSTGYYGDVTAQSVLRFQIANNLMPINSKWPQSYPSSNPSFGAGFFGPRTAARLNKDLGI